MRGNGIQISLPRATPTVAEMPLVRIAGVSKAFGNTKALTNVSFEIREGESHALVGRNGAGKSTLVGLLSGLQAPDQGVIYFSGEKAPTAHERERWYELVACVHQRPTIVPQLSVAENLFLYRHPAKCGGFFSWSAMRRRAHALLDEYGIDLPVTAEASNLTVEQRQLVEISRALSRGSRFIILDEPTAQLEASQHDALFRRIHDLQTRGVTFLYISHHLAEIYELCQSVTILRNGAHIRTARVDDMPTEKVIEAMVGTALTAGQKRRLPSGGKEIVLDVQNLTLDGVFRDVSFTVRAGEAIGIAGLAGSGKTHLGDAIVGLLKPTSGSVAVGGCLLPPGEIAGAIDRGIGYVPQDRHRRGMVHHLGVGENITLSITRRLSRGGLLDASLQRVTAGTLMKNLDVVAASQEQPIGDLSGGNQQKAVVARALASKPRALILHYPTYGVDIASKETLFRIIETVVLDGAAAVVISDELDELERCERVLVMSRGELTVAFEGEWLSQDVVAAMEGRELVKERRMTNTPMELDAMTLRNEPIVVRAGRMLHQHARSLALVPALIVTCIIGSVISPVFFTPQNLINVAQQSSEVAVMVVGLTLILIVGRFDLSLESTFGLAPMLGTYLILPAATNGAGIELPIWMGIALIFVTGAVVGAINGALIVRFGLNAFIVTLAMLILLRGLVLGMVAGQTMYGLPAPLVYLGSARWFGVPVSVWTSGGLFLAAGFFLSYHRLGRALYAVGGNAEAAHAAGIPVKRIVFSVFVIGGLLAALAGLMQSGRVASVTPIQGANLIFTCFAAAVIGGISLNGGRGSMFGAFTGVILLGLIQNILTLSQIASYWINASFGAIILIALILSRLTSREEQNK
jgi:simple sugar transport system ATP-binding protein